MRAYWLAPFTLVVASALTAQTPPAATSDPKLDEVLQQWEKAMTSIQSLLVHINRTTIDKTYQTTEVFEGTAKYLKSNLPGQPSRASLELVKRGQPQVFEKLICTGTFLYEYAPQTKVIRVHELPPPKAGQVADDNIFNFVFGMKAADAKQRYHLFLVPPPPNDKWYAYIKIQPRHPADKAEFTEARLVLIASSHLPRQFWYQQPNGNEVTWDFPRLINNADIRATEFVQPPLPAGWQLQRISREQPPPRVVRPNQ